MRANITKAPVFPGDAAYWHPLVFANDLGLQLQVLAIFMLLFSSKSRVQ